MDVTDLFSRGLCYIRNSELEMKTLFSAVSQNRESRELAGKRTTKERPLKVVTTLALENVFGSES